MSLIVVITGGGGFLGQCLATHLLQKPTLDVQDANEPATVVAAPIAKIVLADIFLPDSFQPEIQKCLDASSSQVQVETVKGDVSDPSFVDELYQKAAGFENLSVFHLGAVMSGDGERDFDLCMRVNLHGTIHMLEGARRWGSSDGKSVPKFVLTSAGATIGSGSPTDYVQKDDTISDASRATPHTTYGATKACAELLLSDYGRRHLVNARGLRLPTICVRAGQPNAATTGCFSGVVREPLNGVDIALPIAREVKHAVTGKRHAIQALVQLHDASNSKIDEVLGFDRTVFLPAVALSLGDLQGALYDVIPAASHVKLGKIAYEKDEALSAVVGSFPINIDSNRALKLGIPEAPSAERLVREYMEDFPEACQGLEVSRDTVSLHTPSVEKVAVVTGAGSGIGQAISVRLAAGGWAVVLAGRRQATLEETAKLIGSENVLCVPTDVTDASQVDQLFSKAKSTFGRVDLLFNNAGINCGAATIEDVSPSDFESVMKTNVTGPFLCARAAIRFMKENEGGGGGRIVNNGSISAHVPRPGSAPYTCSKHAILGLTKCIALDGRPHNIACGQIDFGNVVSQLSLATNAKGKGALQPNGTLFQEPSMSLADAAETFWTMANLPLSANILQMTVMATNMPFVGRG